MGSPCTARASTAAFAPDQTVTLNRIDARRMFFEDDAQSTRSARHVETGCGSRRSASMCPAQVTQGRQSAEIEKWSVAYGTAWRRRAAGPDQVAIWSQSAIGVFATAVGKHSVSAPWAEAGTLGRLGRTIAKCLIWRARQDLNLRPLPSEGSTLSN